MAIGGGALSAPPAGTDELFPRSPTGGPFPPLPPDEADAVAHVAPGVTVTVWALCTVRTTDDGEPQVVEMLSEFARVRSSAEVMVTVSPGFIAKENDEGLTATFAVSNELVALSTYWLLSDGKMMVTS
jgi:hypothetical protein